jgi:hypothetical protein
MEPITVSEYQESAKATEVPETKAGTEEFEAAKAQIVPNVTSLDVARIKVPIGYKVIIDPELVEKERRENEKTELQKRLAEMGEPTNEELIEYAKIFHPYYAELRKLNELS